MKIFLSHIENHNSYASYSVACKIPKQGCGSFTIISRPIDELGNITLNDQFQAQIRENRLSLMSVNKNLPQELCIGGKSSGQLKLRQLGCRTPDTVVLDFSLFDSFKTNGNLELKELYDQQIAKRLGQSLAIRSSSNLEDGEVRSFAGAFDTYLDVPNDYKSFRRRILQSYQKFSKVTGISSSDSSKGIRSDLKLGIMIQSMVKPRFSGFLFTLHPMNPPNQKVKIEFTKGRHKKSCDYSLTLDDRNGRVVPGDRDNGNLQLPLRLQRRLFHVSQKLIKHYGFPQDAEFVVSEENGRLYLIQSRPITAFSYSPDGIHAIEKRRLTQIWKDNIELYQMAPILSSTNISELFVRAIPLGYSIFKYGFAGTQEKEGGISIGRSRLGYAKLDFDDQINFFYTVADQARTNLIVDALTFRLPWIGKKEYLDLFVADYFRQIEENPKAAQYPEDGLYLQNDDEPESWHKIAQNNGETLRKQYSRFQRRLFDYHAPREYRNAVSFFTKSEEFYRSRLRREWHSATEDILRKLIEEIMEFLRTSFCPQYVIYARLAFLSTHLVKHKLKKMVPSDAPFSVEQILNELLRNVPQSPGLAGPDYPNFERLLKGRRISLWDFLEKFQHFGSLDIMQPRLGEYSIKELHSIFGQKNSWTPFDDRQLSDAAAGNGIEPAVLELQRNKEFWKLCTFASQFMRLREKAKFEFLKPLYLLKRAVTELARIYSLGELIFYLEYEQVMKLRRNTRNRYRLLALQKCDYFAACKQHPVHDVLLDLRATPFRTGQSRSKRHIKRGDKAIKGQPIYYGKAEGVCLTARSNEEYLKKLINYRRRKKWPIIGVFKGVDVPYFNLSELAGFTTEHGGYLSHAATSAREFRIPYITGIPVVELHDGDYVILDTANNQVINEGRRS